MVGNARRSARAISSTFSCTLMTLIDGAARQWKLKISPASVSRTRTLWMSWSAALVATRDRHGRDGEVGVAEDFADGILRRFLDRLDAVDRVGARHLCDRVDEMRRPDHAGAQALDADHAGHRGDRGGGLLRYALRCAI